MDWDNPEERLRLLELVGRDEYCRRLEEHRRMITVAVVCGHALRPANSVHGTLFTVGDTGRAFQRLSDAVDYARKIGPPVVSS